jgi:hypothetical protein
MFQKAYSNHAWTLFNKITYSFSCNNEFGCIIYIMYVEVIIQKISNLKHSFKLNAKNTKIGLMNQHMSQCVIFRNGLLSTTFGS